MQSHSAVILSSLPDDFMSTLDELQDYLNDDCICAVVSGCDAETANKLMLNCLIDSHKEDVIGFCNVLERIPTLSNIMSNLRQGIVCICVHMCELQITCTVVKNNTNKQKYLCKNVTKV